MRMDTDLHAVPTRRSSDLELALESTPAGWRLDLDRLFAACDHRTRAIYFASPGNPTGWVMPAEQQQAVLDFCRSEEHTSELQSLTNLVCPLLLEQKNFASL